LNEILHKYLKHYKFGRYLMNYISFCASKFIFYSIFHKNISILERLS